MSEENYRTELERFKTFINNHPKLRRDIRKNGKSWQEIYEQWVLLGEDDEYWDAYREKEPEKTNEKEGTDSDKDNLFAKFNLKPDMVKQVLKYAETLDMEKLQEQVQQLSKTISTVQQIVSQYQQPDQQANQERRFDWFMD